ncbi:MAG: biotin/lipoyl-binding protein, partial [Porphyrobacter sp.]|nr:biotin/lipoyl-binding protein [Porphyrobacter sp.]
MAFSLRNLSFSRQLLPILAVIGVIGAAFYIVFSLPDRAIAEPGVQPPRATGELADAPRVAGAGLVEPASEIIDIGSALSGLVTALRVAPGDKVAKGQPLFLVDDRAARAALAEAGAAIAEARAAIAEASAAQRTARQQLDLYRQLDDPAAVSRAEVIRVEGEEAAATSRLALARARLAAAAARAAPPRPEIQRLPVRAPLARAIPPGHTPPRPSVSTPGGGPPPPLLLTGPA